MKVKEGNLSSAMYLYLRRNPTTKVERASVTKRNNFHPVVIGFIWDIYFEGASFSENKESFIYCPILRWSVIFIIVSNENVPYFTESCKFIGMISLFACFFRIELKCERRNSSLFLDITRLKIGKPNWRGNYQRGSHRNSW